MHLDVAKALIEQAITKTSFPQRWIDLGAGEGLFTTALSTIIPANSTITAIDKNASALEQIAVAGNIVVEKIVADFSNLPNLPLQDGIILANALHYVARQADFLSRLKTSYLKPCGVIVLIEYDLTVGNKWVPYPIPASRLLALSQSAGFSECRIVHEVPSRLNGSQIYSAQLKS